MTDRHPLADMADAATLRHAAWVVQQRSRRKTFAIRVIIRVLERMADRLDPARIRETAVGSKKKGTG